MSPKASGTNDVAAIVLAAGESKRFKSGTPKVLHALCGKPLLIHVLDAVHEAGVRAAVVVAGRAADEVRAAVGFGVIVAEQQKRLGTADAARIGEEALPAKAKGDVLVTAGDTPLLDPATLKRLVAHHRDSGAAATVLTATFPDPTGYGRIVRGPDGGVDRIVEEADATRTERAIAEGNAGVYVFDRAALRSALTKVEASNKQGELYLTDVVAVLREKGERVEAFLAPGHVETLGVNDRVQLADAAAIVRRRILERLMRDGVTVEDPATTYVDASVRVGRDTTIAPMTFLQGATTVGEGCSIGPNVTLVDCTIGDRVAISQAVARETVVKDDASIGPFASLRPGTVLMQSAKAGTFVEMKKTVVGRGSKVPHLSYMGDATIGRDANVGAGTITCNYDGETKTKSGTEIGDEVLIGSDTMLVAPVKLGKRAVTGAGSVVNRDVKAGDVVVGAPATVRRKRKPPPPASGKKGHDR